MTLSQVLQKRMEEFEKEFGSAVKEYDLEFGPWDGTSLGDDLKSFSLATSLALVESFEEVVKGMKDKPFTRMGYTGEKAVRNQALDDLLKLLSEERELIKKMI